MTGFMIKIFLRGGVSRLVFLTPGLLCEDPGRTKHYPKSKCAFPGLEQLN